MLCTPPKTLLTSHTSRLQPLNHISMAFSCWNPAMEMGLCRYPMMAMMVPIVGMIRCLFALLTHRAALKTVVKAGLSRSASSTTRARSKLRRDAMVGGVSCRRALVPLSRNVGSSLRTDRAVSLTICFFAALLFFAMQLVSLPYCFKLNAFWAMVTWRK